MIRIHPANLFTELLELERITETNLSLYVILREAINRIPSPTIPGQHNRAFLNTLVAFIHDHLKKSLVNDSLQGIAPALLVMALEEYSSNKTQANNIVWEEVFSARITDIQDEEACNETLQALRIFVLKYLIYNLQNWGDQEIGEDLLTVAHIFHIQITGHAEIDTNPHKELLAHIIATEIYMLLEYLKLPTSVSNACSSLDQARALTKNSDYTS